MKIPMRDIVAEIGDLRGDIDAAIARVLDSARFIGGPEVEAFESELASAVNGGFAVGVSSGTDALLVSLMALGIGPGDEVVTTPFSFFATAGVISRLGARPVFADIEDDSLNLDPARAAAACTSRTRAIIPASLFGRPASLPRPGGDADIPIVEDAAQSLGAAPVRSAFQTVSFFPAKNLGAMGDGGAVLTRDDALADRVRVLRTHGARPKYFHDHIGGNFRLDALHAAVLRVKLPRFAGWVAARVAAADRYRAMFAQIDVPDELRLPAHCAEHNYNQFVIRAPRRDALRQFLADAGVATAVYYPPALAPPALLRRARLSPRGVSGCRAGCRRSPGPADRALSTGRKTRLRGGAYRRVLLALSHRVPGDLERARGDVSGRCHEALGRRQDDPGTGQAARQGGATDDLRFVSDARPHTLGSVADVQKPARAGDAEHDPMEDIGATGGDQDDVSRPDAAGRFDTHPITEPDSRLHGAPDARDPCSAGLPDQLAQQIAMDLGARRLARDLARDLARELAQEFSGNDGKQLSGLS